MDRFDRLVSRVAKSVSALSDDVFTEERPIRFKPEGSTINSLNNARFIRNAGYDYVKSTMVYDNVRGDWKVEAFFRRGNGPVVAHIFGGFSFGYGGEGPRGLLEFAEIFGFRLDSEKVTSHSYKESMAPRGAVDLVAEFA